MNPSYLIIGIPQIEYMVISFDKEEKNAKLSLRQTEILQKLGSIVSDITADCADE